MKKSLLYSLVFLFALVGCESEQAGQDVVEVASTKNYPTPSFTLDQTDTTVNEGGETVFTYTITLDKPIDRPIDFTMVQVGGDATLHEDYEIASGSVPAYETTGTMSVIILNDSEVEGTETLELAIESGPSLANKYLVNPETTYPEPLTITIENYVSDALNMSFAWDKEITIEGEIYTTCEYVDLDVFVSDAASFDITDPWASWNDTGYAASADCPETMSMDFETWADGEYILWHENYFNGFAGEGTGELIPVTATFTRPGLFEVQLTQDESQALNADNEGTSQDNPVEPWGFIAKVTIDNGTYTITDFEGNVIN